MTNVHFCNSCGATVPDQARFCQQCGINLTQGFTAPSRKALTSKQLSILVAFTAAVWGIAWATQGYLAGEKPEKVFQQASSSSTSAKPGASGHGANSGESVAAKDPMLAKLKAAAEANPQDKEAWRSFAAGLIDQLRATENPSSDLIFETIDALREILKLDPADTGALVGIADISFDMQAFAKAAEFYEKYLAQQPQDHAVRARYASSLSFSGKSDDALKELNSVLNADPKNFQATAYMAVTYAQMGNKDKAKEVGNKALELAPSPEARARFSDFMKSVDEKTAAIAPPANASPVDAVVAHIKQNPVAGPKFARHELQDGVLKLYFTNFPMSQMPPFVREKFTNEVKDKVLESKAPVSKILFLDADTKEELHAIETVTSRTQ